MEKENGALNTYNHSINLLERKNLIITGVKKIENFDSINYLLENAKKNKEDSVFNRLFK